MLVTMVESGSPIGVSTAPIPMAKQPITITCMVSRLLRRRVEVTSHKTKAAIMAVITLERRERPNIITTIAGLRPNFASINSISAVTCFLNLRNNNPVTSTAIEIAIGSLIAWPTKG